MISASTRNRPAKIAVRHAGEALPSLTIATRPGDSVRPVVPKAGPVRQSP